LFSDVSIFRDCRSARRHLGAVPKARRPQIRWIARMSSPGRPPIGKQIEELIVRMVKEKRSWGYDRIVGALVNLGHQVSVEGLRGSRGERAPAHS
jgi:hypothetical protein